MTPNKVLIVDDDTHIVELIRLNLKNEGFETCTAYDGEKALELFRSEAPSIVILDVMMPKMDGLDVYKRQPL